MATAGVRHTCTHPFQANVVRSTTRTTKQQPCKRTAVAGYIVNVSTYQSSLAFCANKSLGQQMTLVMVPLWLAGSRHGWEVIRRKTLSLQMHALAMLKLETNKVNIAAVVV